MNRGVALDLLAMDVELAHRRHWPDRPLSLASRLWLLATSPGLRLMLMHRLAHWLYLKRTAGGRQWLWRLVSISLVVPKWAIKVATKSDISNRSEIAGGVCFSDQGHIIFGARKTGEGSVIGTRVTIGMSLENRQSPEIGRNVWIGQDCVVYGDIRIGDGATLLPGTVLTRSIPAGVVMQGNPAQQVLRNFDNAELRTRHEVDAMQSVKAKQGGLSVREYSC